MEQRGIALTSVASPRFAGSGFIVSRHRFERLVRDTMFQHFEIENADQSITATNAVVKEGERLTLRVAFEPECHAAEFDSQWVLVYAVNTVRDDLADCLADTLGSRLVLASAHAG